MRKVLVPLLVVLFIFGSGNYVLPSTTVGYEDGNEEKFNLDINVSILDDYPFVGGQIDPVRAGITDPEPGSHNYSKNAEITVTAIPEEGWRFTHWSGDVPEELSEEREFTISMEDNKNLTANFRILEEDEYLRTERETYKPREDVVVEVKNNGSAGLVPIIYSFRMQIQNKETGKIVHGPLSGPGLDVVPPYGHTEHFIWNQTYQEGGQVPEGTYIVKSEHDGLNYTYEFTISSEEDDEDIPGFTMLPLTFTVIISGLTYRMKKGKDEKR